MDDFRYNDIYAELGMLRWDIDRRTAIYARQSRANGRSFGSCQAQLGICRDLALGRRWIVTRVFTDQGKSSDTLDRPALKQLIAAIKTREVDRLIVYSIDRLTRRLADLHVLLELIHNHQVELVVVTDPSYGSSAANQLATNLIAAGSQFQQELTGERLADARAALKRRGKRVAGRVPFGYRADPRTKKLTPDPEQQPIVRDFFRLAADGALPSDLASLANLNAWKDQDGEIGKWTARRIIALMKNPIYMGMIRNGNSTLPGEHEAVVSCDLFDSVQQQLAGRRTRQPQPRDGKRPDNPWGVNLSGLLICGQCDRPMSTSVSHRGPIRYIYYRCRSNAGGRKPCPGANVSAYEMERFICGVLASDPVIPDDLRRFWRTLDALTQQKSLTKFIDRVVYHHAGGRISVTVRDDWDVVASSSTRTW